MSRSSFALLTLLATLAGPLVFAPAARSEQPLPTCPAEAYNARSVCTPPAEPVHPTDNGLVPHPGYHGEYADADAEASWRSPTPAKDEDWRSFVIENKQSSITNRYDDLFETLNDVAVKTYDLLHSKVVEADISAYSVESTKAPEYDPYAANASDEDPEYASIEAYEAEFSGYGTTDYLRDNFGYEAERSRSTKSLSTVAVAWYRDAWRNQLVTSALEAGSETWFLAQQLRAEYNFDAIVDASELAWDRLEEYNRLTRRPLPTVETREIGYRLATDDCGWDCWFGERSLEVAPRLPQVSHDAKRLEREALLTAAVSLRTLAGHLEAASDWIANLGGIDVAEVKSSIAR